MGPLAGGPNAAARASRDGGFTLIELLVVIAILAIAAALVVVSLPESADYRAEREARRLAGTLEHAAAAAQWRGETLGVSADGTTYRFWHRGADDRWSALGDDDVLAPHALPPGVTVVPATWAGAPVPANAILPFRASGRNEPYALALTSSTWSFVVTADPLNRVQIVAAASR